MDKKLDYGLLYCENRDIFYVELMYNNTQWGEVVLDSNKIASIKIWDCNFMLPVSDLVDLISKASTRLVEFESSRVA